MNSETITVTLEQNLKSAFAEVKRVQSLFDNQPARTRQEQLQKIALREALEKVKQHAFDLQQLPPVPSAGELARDRFHVPGPEDIAAIRPHVLSRIK